ncbi:MULTISPECIES: helix-turn-helix domain-containing protein [unclassified Serratia (in: enterobacteria)]|uniref:winged helix-turn-helix domain-containing protein n=1 Tax=unclassified Serratia (in: enterobacteria) TaxID=2647522 RepID=UPI000469160C|nr:MULTISPECIES: helix-turn-helix domain-containing protein [unclassified Serratia (in: enterobacteria)]
MEKIIFGYYIGTDVHFDLNKKTLVNVNINPRSHQRMQVMLRDTMFRLFVFLIEHANGSIIHNSEILLNVWDKHGLSSSNQRLWQVMQALKFKLNLVGVPDDFIMRVESKGYYVKEHILTVLYSEKMSSQFLEKNHDLRHF